MQRRTPRASIRAPTTMQIGPRIREFPVNAILAAYESLSSSSPGPRYDAAETEKQETRERRQRSNEKKKRPSGRERRHFSPDTYTSAIFFFFSIASTARSLATTVPLHMCVVVYVFENILILFVFSF